jgi:hypothetical protein
VHEANVALARTLHGDLQQVMRGFAELPVDAALQAVAPEPLAWTP